MCISICLSLSCNKHNKMFYIVETHLDHVPLCVKVDPRVGLGHLGVVCIFLVLELQLVSLLVPHVLSLSL